MKQRFFQCSRCGQIINIIKDTNLPIMCCMADMIELIPNTADASKEKHVPEVIITDKKVAVKVGSDFHPMTSIHYIMWIMLQTKKGTQIVHLNPEEEPIAFFHLGTDDVPEAVYAYCNQHGLWMKELHCKEK